MIFQWSAVAPLPMWNPNASTLAAICGDPTALPPQTEPRSLALVFRLVYGLEQVSSPGAPNWDSVHTVTTLQGRLA